MEGECRKIELEQGVGESAFAMSEVALDIATPCFQGIEAFVLDAPANSSGLRDNFRGILVDRQGGDEFILRYAEVILTSIENDTMLGRVTPKERNSMYPLPSAPCRMNWKAGTRWPKQMIDHFRAD